ncbi:ribosome biogenesis factor YjgA [Psychromonas hadalis]|uniref:ribosome biogenesis factor YjgA n=1 Tax=Psychromonas hadalis TaxID=211669 RepID=UPI0003B38675|nr:ribosome biogenesis factor YjgA [Psychromonas hadalis]
MNKKVEIIEEDEISKTQIKREADVLKLIGRALIALNKKQLAQIPGSELLFHSISVAHKIMDKNEALRRQIQYIGKVLRNEDCDAIRTAIDKLNNKHQQLTHATQRLERLRDELVEQGDSKINELLEQFPTLERQKLRQLVRQVNKEKKAEKQAKSEKVAKDLFNYLKPVCL